MDCLTPSLNTCPEGDWICPDCVLSPQHTGNDFSIFTSDGKSIERVPSYEYLGIWLDDKL